MVMCLHIGTGFGAISMAKDAPIDNLIILATQVSAMCAQDLLWGPAMRNYPDLKFAFSEIGIDIIAWECDYPHSDCFWPDAPEQVLAELNAAGASDSDINKITWQNSCRFFGWDPLPPRIEVSPGSVWRSGSRGSRWSRIRIERR